MLAWQSCFNVSMLLQRQLSYQQSLKQLLEGIHCKKRRVILTFSCSSTSWCVLIVLTLHDPSRISRLLHSFVIAYLDCYIHLLFHACARQGAERNQYSMTCGIVWLMNLYRTLYPHTQFCVLNILRHHLILWSDS